MNSFRSYVWDPGLIVSQMICMQATFYTTQCVVSVIFSIGGDYPSLGQVFTTEVTLHGAITQLLSAAVCSLIMSKVVGRSKQCLDFTCTLHFWHLIIVTLYYKSIPNHIFWWLLQFLSIVLCTVLGEYFCLQLESRDIQLSTNLRHEV
ncbi:Integral membrane protein S linking to the trans Golgi network family protein [Acanthocheilonema viteae]